MTDKKTLSLAPREWNALLASNADDLAAFFKAQHQPNAELYQQVLTHLERMKAILPGWLASATAAAPEAPQGEQEAVQHGNGAGPKGKGGWPLGKKRTRKQPEAMQ